MLLCWGTVGQEDSASKCSALLDDLLHQVMPAASSIMTPHLWQHVYDVAAGVPSLWGAAGYREGTSSRGFSLSMMAPNPGRSPGSAQVCSMSCAISAGSVSGTGSLALSQPTAPTTYTQHWSHSTASVSHLHDQCASFCHQLRCICWSSTDT